MILSRRKAHLYLISALCCTVPLVAIAGLILRPSVPISDEETLFTAASFADPDSATLQTFSPLAVNDTEVLVRTVQRGDKQMFLELQPQKALEFSDVLVYWLPSQAASESIDDSAVLLGQLSGTSRRQFMLFPGLIDPPSQLLFYSQGQQQTIAQVSLVTTQSPE